MRHQDAPARSPFTCVLWDVDGTIIDASEGIFRRLSAALAHFGRTPPAPAELAHWIGPPLNESFRINAGMEGDEVDRIVAHYRELAREEGFASGARLYPGIAEVISELAAAGIPQATASSKPEDQVVHLMHHFGLADAFVAMAGASYDLSVATKAQVIAEALRRLDAAGVDTSRPVLIGDRHHDIDGAAVHGIPVIFAEWGFSWPHEADGAAWRAASPAELPPLLLVHPWADEAGDA